MGFWFLVHWVHYFDGLLLMGYLRFYFSYVDELCFVLF